MPQGSPRHHENPRAESLEQLGSLQTENNHPIARYEESEDHRPGQDLKMPPSATLSPQMVHQSQQMQSISTRQCFGPDESGQSAYIGQDRLCPCSKINLAISV